MQLKQNVAEIRRRVQERKEAMEALCRFLVSKGISTTLAEQMILELAQEGEELSYIKEILAKRIKISEDLHFEQLHKIAFVGPTGVGKTTLILKLIEFYKQKQKKVAIHKLGEKSENHSSLDLLFIDTEGCNYYEKGRIEILGEQLSEYEGDIQVILTLSAAIKEVDLYGAIHQFSSLCPSALAYTKLDETLSAGVIINVSEKTDLPTRYIGYGYPLPGEVQLADANLIAHKILTDFNDEEYHFIRQLTMQ